MISTGPFNYMHMLAVYSARIHTNKLIRMWYTVLPSGVYFEQIRHLVQLIPFNMPAFPALKGKDDFYRKPHSKDYIEWLVLFNHGGIYLDLDTISIKDLNKLVKSDKIVVTCLEPNTHGPIYNNSVVCVGDNANRVAMKDAMLHACSVLESPDMAWAETGPATLEHVLPDHMDDIQEVDYRVLSPWTCGNNGIQNIYRENTDLVIPDETYVVHLFASATREFSDNVDAAWVASSTSCLAKLIRQIFPVGVWTTMEIQEYDIEPYLSDMGQRFRDIFTIIKETHPKHIFEIGTSHGRTAIAMLKTADPGIQYTGIDLFEDGENEKLAEEFSGHFGHAVMVEIKNNIERETGAAVRLIKGDSRHITTDDCAFADLVYIDGGHSIETVRSDWKMAQELMKDDTVVIFDDYFEEMTFVGAKTVVDAIDRNIFDVRLSSETDEYPVSYGRLRIKIAIVTKKHESGGTKMDSKMDLHFISTGPFGYIHMLSVYTASIVQKVDKINLWYTVEPKGVFYDAIKDLVNPIDMTNSGKIDVPALRNKDPIFRAVHLKDRLQWMILSSHGGLSMDLDVISLSDVTELLGDDHVMFASLDVEDPSSIAFPYNNSIVCVNPKAIEDDTCFTPLASITRFVEGKLQNDVTWGDTGPIAVSTILNECQNWHSANWTAARLVPHKVLCPWGGHEIQQIYQENTELALQEETRTIHLFAKATGKLFDQVNATWVKNSSSLLARTIRDLVPASVWGMQVGWDTETYLHSRGQHYRGLFELIENNSFKNIMEIGTSAGETAIGMIKTAGRVAGGEEKIHYYGIDLFEYGKPAQWEMEFSGGYRPPTKDEVYIKLLKDTNANIKLTACDSRNLNVPEADPDCYVAPQLPPMDLIFIDGGHSIETVMADWKTAQKLMHADTAVVFDDYFQETPFVGCKVIVDEIDRALYDVKIHPTVDDYAHPWGRLRTQLALVTKRSNLLPIPEPGVAPMYKNQWAADIMQKVAGR
jgi:predicted O-methyltransferase YrrM